MINLLGRRVAGDEDEDEEDGLLSCGGAKPPLRDPKDFEVVGEVEPVFTPPQVGSFWGFELLLKISFKLPSIFWGCEGANKQIVLKEQLAWF
jgi:hypothetical protein